MNLKNQIIKANNICDLCKKYHIDWNMSLAGVTIYYPNSNEGVWFPLACVEKAENLILQIANVDNKSQSTLNQYL